MRGLARRIRSSFSIGSSRMAIRSQLAWYWRWLLNVLLMVLVATVVWWLMQNSYRITGFDMIPGDASNVHHVNIFLNPPDDEVDFVQYDLEDPAPGFSCGRGDRILSSVFGSGFTWGAAIFTF